MSTVPFINKDFDCSGRNGGRVTLIIGQSDEVISHAANWVRVFQGAHAQYSNWCEIEFLPKRARNTREMSGIPYQERLVIARGWKFPERTYVVEPEKPTPIYDQEGSITSTAQIVGTYTVGSKAFEDAGHMKVEKGRADKKFTEVIGEAEIAVDFRGYELITDNGKDTRPEMQLIFSTHPDEV